MKVQTGVYKYTTPDGLEWHVVRIIDADPGSAAQGRWYFDGGENDGEGGHDHFDTKKDAIAALHEYVAHRKYVEPYGWCYWPYDDK